MDIIACQALGRKYLGSTLKKTDETIGGMDQRPNRKRADYTEGPILGSILRMGLPSMFGFLSQNIYTLADTFWVSRLPEKEAGVAAITFFANLLWVVFSFNHLVGPGSVAVISRRYGQKDFAAAERAIKETVLLKLIFGLIIGVIGFLFIRPLMQLVGAEGLSLELGISYGSVMFLGLPILFATYSIFTAMRSVANPQLAMGLMIGSNLLNLGLDPLFIFGWFGLPEWGLVGVAYASVTSFSLTFLLGIVLFQFDITNVRVRLNWARKPTIKTMWQIVRIGIPAWLGELSFSSSRMVITPIVAMFGTAVVAAYGVGMQIFGFGIMLLVGIGLGLSSLIGHTVGSGKIERAKKTADQSVLLSIAIMAAYGVAVYFGARFIMDLFFESPETIDAGVTLLRIFAVGFPFYGAFIMLENVHSGVGLNTPVMVVNIIQSWLLQALPILVAVKFFNMPATVIWWLFTIAGMASTLGMYWYYRKGRWLTAEV